MTDEVLTVVVWTGIGTIIAAAFSYGPRPGFVILGVLLVLFGNGKL